MEGCSSWGRAFSERCFRGGGREHRDLELGWEFEVVDRFMKKQVRLGGLSRFSRVVRRFSARRGKQICSL